MEHRTGRKFDRTEVITQAHLPRVRRGAKSAILLVRGEPEEAQRLLVRRGGDGNRGGHEAVVDGERRVHGEGDGREHDVRGIAIHILAIVCIAVVGKYTRHCPGDSCSYRRTGSAWNNCCSTAAVAAAAPFVLAAAAWGWTSTTVVAAGEAIGIQGLDSR